MKKPQWQHHPNRFLFFRSSSNWCLAICAVLGLNTWSVLSRGIESKALWKSKCNKALLGDDGCLTIPSQRSLFPAVPVTLCGARAPWISMTHRFSSFHSFMFHLRSYQIYPHYERQFIEGNPSIAKKSSNLPLFVHFYSSTPSDSIMVQWKKWNFQPACKGNESIFFSSTHYRLASLFREE